MPPRSAPWASPGAVRWGERPTWPCTTRRCSANPGGLWRPDVLAAGTAEILCDLVEPDDRCSRRTARWGCCWRASADTAMMRGFASTNSPRTFGHMGAGGQVSWADPSHRPVVRLPDERARPEPAASWEPAACRCPLPGRRGGRGRRLRTEVSGSAPGSADSAHEPGAAVRNGLRSGCPTWREGGRSTMRARRPSGTVLPPLHRRCESNEGIRLPPAAAAVGRPQRRPALATNAATGLSTTYAEHLDRVSRLIGGMRALGLERDDRFAVLALNSPEYLELYHAGFLGGGVVNPAQPPLRTAGLIHVLRDSETRTCFVDAVFAPVHRRHPRGGRARARRAHRRADVPHTATFDELLATGRPGDARRGGGVRPRRPDVHRRAPPACPRACSSTSGARS